MADATRDVATRTQCVRDGADPQVWVDGFVAALSLLSAPGSITAYHHLSADLERAAWHTLVQPDWFECVAWQSLGYPLPARRVGP